MAINEKISNLIKFVYAAICYIFALYEINCFSTYFLNGVNIEQIAYAFDTLIIIL